MNTNGPPETQGGTLLMSCKDPRAATDPDADSNQAADDRDQAAVLAHVLVLYPAHLTIPDLVREVTTGATELEESDRMERAIRDLTAAGLLHCPGGLVVPSRAALRFDELLGGQG
jgi:hypothetical protein